VRSKVCNENAAQKRMDYYAGVKRERKQKGLDELITEVNRQYQMQREVVEL
jgi:hypothetical protein